MNSKLKRYMSSISGFDANDAMMKRMAFLQYHNAYVKHCDDLKAQGEHGKAYSDAVVAYSKQTTIGFN